MHAVTHVWSTIATVSLTLAVFCALAWALDRRKVSYLMFCAIAIATAACGPFELGMMHSSTPAEYGRWLRGYHLPVFFVVLSQMLFVYFYLGTARRWLLFVVIAWRFAILAVNFSVEPNFNFREISTLDQFLFLGGQVSVVGEATPRSWQWLGITSMLLMMVFVVDAAIRRWHKGDSESRRKAVVIGIGFAGPMILNVGFNQLLVLGVVQAPIFNMFWFMGTVATAAYKLGRDMILNHRARLQVAHLRGELAQLGRVDTLGQLASGIAHELAQPLTATLGNAEAAQKYLRKDDPDLGEIRVIVDDIQRDAGRAADIIERMRMLIRRQAIDKQSVAIDQVLQDVTNLLHSEAIRRGIELSVKVDQAAPRALGDRVQISQVLLNLVINAMDALDSCAHGDKRVLVEAHSAQGGGVEVTVTDSGPGIPGDKMQEIFNPLFTTKPGGLGLGLALSRTIIDAHGGRLWAENRNAGTGAVLRMVLPAA
jgi:signal transduction histidine kinase